MTINDTIGLNLYRDGKRPAVQAGKFGPSEQMRNPAGLEQAVILDRFDGGVGAVERMVPYTYPLAIDGCTRFSRAWTPSGEITDLGTPAPFGGNQPGRIRSMIGWTNNLGAHFLVVAAGQLIYQLRDDATSPYTFLYPMGAVDPGEEVQDLLVFQGILVAGTRHTIDGTPGKLWAYDEGTDTWLSTSTCLRQHLVKTYMTIDNVGAWRLIGNDSTYTFRFLATGDIATAADLVNDTKWAGGGTTPYTVGDSSSVITNLAGSPLVMFFAKEDGVYHVGPDGRSARIADWSGSKHWTNGEVFEFAYGGLYASHVRWGLVRVDVANLQVQWQTNACAPGANLPRVVPGAGQITAFGMDGEWMVAGVFNGTDSYTYYGRPVEITERTAMINLQSPQSLNWHGSEGTFWGKRVSAYHQATLGTLDRPLLWVGLEDVHNGLINLACISLPKYGTPLEDWISGGPHRFQPQSWLYFPRQDWGEDRNGGAFSGWASVRKVFNRLDLSAEYLQRYTTWIDAYMASSDTTHYVDADHKGGLALFFDRADSIDPDNPSLWTAVGRFDEGERISLVPGKVVQSGTKASLLLRGYGDRQHPFAFYGAKLRGTPTVEQSERRTYRVTLGRSRKANQSTDHRELLASLNELWALQWADPVPLLDQYRLPLIVDVEPSMSYEDVTNPSTSEPTVVVTFTCRIVRRGFFWGTGYRWGSDIVWSGFPSPPTA